MPAYFRRHKSFDAQENMFRRSGGRLRGLHTFVNPLTDLSLPRAHPFPASTFHFYNAGRKIYGPLNDSTDFNCRVAGYYRVPQLRYARLLMD